MWAAITDGAQIEPGVMVFGGDDHRAVIDWPWKLVRLDDGEAPEDPQLFNIVDDPNEQNDLAAEYPEKISELLAAIEAVPAAASKRALGGNSSREFYASGDNKDYQARLEETLPPWAEAAVRGNGGAPN